MRHQTLLTRGRGGGRVEQVTAARSGGRGGEVRKRWGATDGRSTGREGERTKESQARAEREKREREVEEEKKMEGENRQQGFGTPARWHLGSSPGAGLRGQRAATDADGFPTALPVSRKSLAHRRISRPQPIRSHGNLKAGQSSSVNRGPSTTPRLFFCPSFSVFPSLAFCSSVLPVS